jgi:DNA-binding SARP family transcriptional activator/tetratricopeptide (TPR) repeat protein
VVTNFRLLGPLEVRVDEQWREISAPKWKSVLAALLINAGQVVSVDSLIDEVWRDPKPAKAGNLISIYVLRLRRLLGEDGGSLLATRSPGYQLRVRPADTDAGQFEAMVRDGRSALTAGDPSRAAGHLAEALALWRGSPFADVPRSTMVEAETERLSDLKLDASELRITAELACGEHAAVVSDLRRLLADHPFREGLWALLMRALNGSGRHAEALDAYMQARRTLVDELGVEPGAELRRLHAELLAEDTEGGPGDAAGTILAGRVRASTPAAPSRRPPAAPPADTPSLANTPLADAPPLADTPALADTARAGPASPDGAAPPAGPEDQAAEPAAEPPARVPPRSPAQLPADIADFTGREDQIRHMCDLLSGAGEAEQDDGAVRIALVAGHGGLGKTSLAVHAAHRVRHAFPDGQLYVDLLGATAHPLNPADILARFLRDLGVDGRDVPHDEAERAARYRTSLAGRRVLVVLDNAKDAAQVRPLLPGSASCAVLVTTRSRMPDLASTKLVDLNVLDDDEALTLFTKVVGDKRAVTEPEATAELLLACAGLPLAIRICAARLAGRSGWSIQAMANRLRDEHRRLDEMTAGDLAVRASFEVSFSSLPPASRRRGIDPALAFRLLGLWHGPSISSAAAAVLFGSDESRAEDALEVLVDAHLLESKTTDRYKFHDLLRVYAGERAESDLSADDREAAEGRLLGWYMRTADAAATACSPYRYTMPGEAGRADPPALAFAANDEALAWYDAERVNVVAAIGQAAQAGLHDIAWRLAPPLFILCNRRGNWADCIAMHRIALDSARKVGNRRGEAWILNNLGDALGVIQNDEAIGLLEQSLAIREEIEDRMGEAQALSNLADAYEELGRREEAIVLMRRAVSLAREVGDGYREGVALNNLGAALLHLHRYEEAVPFLEEACAVFARFDNRLSGYTLHSLGRSYFSLGRGDEAMDCLRQAVASHEAQGNRPQKALALKTIAATQAQLGLHADAAVSRVQAAEIFDQLGDHEQAAELRAGQRDMS